MNKIKLTNNNGYKWEKYKEIYFKGKVVSKTGELITAFDIFNLFSQCDSFEQFQDNLMNLNGVFSIIICKGDTTLLASDLTRSFPLFFRKFEGYWKITDQLISDNSTIKSINISALEEFKSSGFVIGEKTLIDNVYQLQAAELVELKKDEIIREQYWEYQTQLFNGDTSFNLLVKNLLDIYSNIAKRIAKLCVGKTLIIPLSGGYDSRLIASMVKEANITDVICYTYGRRNCWEAKISKRVADKLGFKWLFVEYTDQEIANFFTNTNHWNKYTNFASNYVSIPHISDFYAVYKMKTNNLIPEKSIFLPGHSGGLFAGSQIPNNIHNIKTKTKVIKTLKTKHFRYSNLEELDITPKDKVKLHSFFENFSWKERQAKFIVNSVKCYEFFNYEFLLPLWDVELSNFFKSIPLSHKNRSSFLNYNSSSNLYDTSVRRVFEKYNIFIEKSFFNNIVPRILCKLIGWCKNKDCLNYSTMKKSLSSNSNGKDHINISVINRTLKELKIY